MISHVAARATTAEVSVNCGEIRVSELKRNSAVDGVSLITPRVMCAGHAAPVDQERYTYILV
jgi:hypothetical protein